MKLSLQLVLISLMTSTLTVFATYFLFSKVIANPWKQESGARELLSDLVKWGDSDFAENNVQQSLYIVEAVREGKTSELLSMACIGLSFSLTEIRPEFHKDSPAKAAYLESLIKEGKKTLADLRRQGQCLAKCNDGTWLPESECK